MFEPFPKIRRYEQEYCVITEKIDGTNACIIIENDEIVGVQSRKRMITPGKNLDNQGFAAWVHDNADALIEALGDGRHYGEWCGPGIQGNPHNYTNRRFFLFNTHKHAELVLNLDGVWVEAVPIMAECPLEDLNNMMEALRSDAESDIEAGYYYEGYMIYLTLTGCYIKAPINKLPKGAQ